jgi:O-methyltransferase
MHDPADHRSMSVKAMPRMDVPIRRGLREVLPRHVVRLVGQEYAAWRRTRVLGPSIAKIRALSMLPEASLVELGETVTATLRAGIAGAFVECGVWRGGASFLMADLLRLQGVSDRKVWLFDSFEGHRAPAAIDGQAALEYARNTDDPGYFDNCRVGVEEVRQSAASLGLDSMTEIVKGWFEETLPTTRDRIGPIAILRLDCDWYDSVRVCLESLYDLVAPRGVVIIDDYFSYEGCAIAVHEFLANRRLAHRIEQSRGVAFFRKA